MFPDMFENRLKSWKAHISAYLNSSRKKLLRLDAGLSQSWKRHVLKTKRPTPMWINFS